VQDQKVNLQKIEMLSCWVEENMQSLLNSFDNDTRKKIDNDTMASASADNVSPRKRMAPQALR
jgi:hypothetical protein